LLAAGADFPPGAVVDGLGGVQADSGMAVPGVVVGEEKVAELAGFAEAGELPGKYGAVLKCFELRFRVRVVVGLTGQYAWSYPLAG
jgi:hypothetical protein